MDLKENAWVCPHGIDHSGEGVCSICLHAAARGVDMPDKEDFIEAHIAVCNLKPIHRKGKGWRRSPSRKRRCAESLWNFCQRLGISPVLHHSDVPDTWRQYDGDYQKHWYDIRLHSGTVVKDCWPNAGSFHSHETGRWYDGAMIEAVRDVEDPIWRKLMEARSERAT